MNIKPLQIPDCELVKIQKPAQYLGGEAGSVVKDLSGVEYRLCFAFPDTYEVGMSHVGIQILYDLINRRPNYWAERVYVPLSDMERLLRERNLELCSLESRTPLNQFDTIGFSLQYELCMTGILTILDLGGVPLLASERGEDSPLVIGGGPVAYHPEPFSDFFDAFLIGDGEELLPQFIAVHLECKKLGLSRHDTLKRLSAIEGVYVPSFFDADYDSAGNFRRFRAKFSNYSSIKRRVISSLRDAPYPTKPVVPNIQAVHDRLSIEVMRGCVRGCRFCQAGYLYRPQRERSPEQILKIVEDSLDSTGYEELSLLSLSTADYCSILPLLSSLKERFAQNDQLAISFPSTRVDALKPELLQEVQPIRRSGFTIAPEAGTQRLRDVINKGVTDDEIMETCRNVFQLGWSSVKMYFMIGLPTESGEDIDGIIDIATRVKKIAGRGKDVTVSVSTLVPKPHTPFQWAAQIGREETVRIQQYLLRELKKRRINFRYHPSFSTFLEGVFARGDRKLSRVILKAYSLGARLEGWSENLSEVIWMKAFEQCAIDPSDYLVEQPVEAALPWDHISCDIPKAYFLKEWKRAQALRTTPDCLTQSCSSCGACDYDAVRNELFDRKRSEERLGIKNPPWNTIITTRETGGDISPLLSSDIQIKAAKEGSGTYKLKEYLRTEQSGPAISQDDGLPAIQRLRIHYEKVESARFYSHFEIKNIFFRQLRRCKAALAFSRGFNPKPKMLFGPPLQLGIASESEFLDLFLSSIYSSDAIYSVFVEKLNSLLPNGLRIRSCREIPLRSEAVQNAVKAMSYAAKPLDDKYQSVVECLKAGQATSRLAAEVTKTRKGKTSAIKLGQCIDRLMLDKEGIYFDMPFSSGVATLKPTEIVTALTDLPSESFALKKIGTILAA